MQYIHVTILGEREKGIVSQSVHNDCGGCIILDCKYAIR